MNYDVTIPDEPDLEKISDNNGTVWTKCDGRWHAPGRNPYTWDRLVRQYGPLNDTIEYVIMREDLIECRVHSRHKRLMSAQRMLEEMVEAFMADPSTVSIAYDREDGTLTRKTDDETVWYEIQTNND